MFETFMFSPLYETGEAKFLEKDSKLSDFELLAVSPDISNLEIYLTFPNHSSNPLPLSLFLTIRLSSSGTQLKLFIIKCKDLPSN